MARPPRKQHARTPRLQPDNAILHRVHYAGIYSSPQSTTQRPSTAWLNTPKVQNRPNPTGAIWEKTDSPRLIDATAHSRILEPQQKCDFSFYRRPDGLDATMKTARERLNFWVDGGDGPLRRPAPARHSVLFSTAARVHTPADKTRGIGGAVMCNIDPELTEREKRRLNPPHPPTCGVVGNRPDS